MSDIDYPQLLDYYKIAYAMPNLISYHDARLSQYFLSSVAAMAELQAYIPDKVSIFLYIHLLCLLIQTTEHQHYIKTSIFFAYIRWYNSTNDNEHRDEGIAICLPEFSADNYHSILPVHRIHLEVATAVDVTDMNEERMLVIPMPKKYYA
ncbi:hypothetical protein PHYBLDRAFT_142980 [Phycomyces blakesleeanus NRRL 1555(-)]|uniref:Uncharacterized protein n=1 Tax=Phycomyces blakesleeanus (strain ATCC 8743b / DSM 1359 / FGSC 10004 / NBRC 33097 / NRRL 1555) TaxID=763407 RepID=A0A162XPB4_PHYB8|nr:hypothetical protein PHYBLDRAFT_142980 [Phycomyces blakesleeanus NRRL 1555(-)]OAD75995.1 hypothetical protein PHYBLDRAFT_142980 [Phycomyces blakesleeanus NRRL 1555(-)]|eukprot:XP_018294035.1 hypothetical protein PHYBLDRAFT_142980 [Phycomyces blakesleeanus NRRL 1555(-)]